MHNKTSQIFTLSVLGKSKRKDHTSECFFLFICVRCVIRRCLCHVHVLVLVSNSLQFLLLVLSSWRKGIHVMWYVNFEVDLITYISILSALLIFRYICIYSMYVYNSMNMVSFSLHCCF